MTLATPYLLEGRRIVAVELHAFDDDRGGTAYNPVFLLDNGARVTFHAQETDTGAYGVKPIYTPKAATK